MSNISETVVNGDRATANVHWFREAKSETKITPIVPVNEQRQLEGVRMSYAGDLTPQEAWKILTEDPTSVLVDCRTEAEWSYVGVPDLSGVSKETRAHRVGQLSRRCPQFRLRRTSCARPASPTISRWFSCVARDSARSGPPRPRLQTGSPRHTTFSTDSRVPSTPPGIAVRSDGRQPACHGANRDHNHIHNQDEHRAMEDQLNANLPEGLSPDTLAVRGGPHAVRLRGDLGSDVPDLGVRLLVRGRRRARVHRRGSNDSSTPGTATRPCHVPGATPSARGRGGMLCHGQRYGRGVRRTGALLKAGDRLVAARSLFGSCFVVCNEILPRWGVETDFVDGEDLEQWEQALSKPTDAVFFETPSNPMQTLVDVERVCELAHAAGAKVVLDNVFATPLLQSGLELGADVIVYSGTKHIDGQGRVMGGAVLGSKEYIDGPVQTLMRHTGPALSPFNAWTLLKGLETMPVRWTIRPPRLCASPSSWRPIRGWPR